MGEVLSQYTLSLPFFLKSLLYHSIDIFVVVIILITIIPGSDFQVIVLCFRRKRNQRNNPRQRRKNQRKRRRKKKQQQRKNQAKRKNRNKSRKRKLLLRHRHRHRPRLCSKCSCIARVAPARFVAPSKDSQVGPPLFSHTHHFDSFIRGGFTLVSVLLF